MKNRKRNRKYRTAKRANNVLSALLIAGMIGSSTLTAFAEPELIRETETVTEVVEDVLTKIIPEEETEKEETAVPAAEEEAEKEEAAPAEEAVKEEAGEEEAEKEEEEKAEAVPAEEAAQEEAAAAEEAEAAPAEEAEQEVEAAGAEEAPKAVQDGGESAYDKIDSSVSAAVLAGSDASRLTLTAAADTFDKFLYLLDFNGDLEGLEGDALYDALLAGDYRTANASGGTFSILLTSACTVYATAYEGEPDAEVSFAKNVASVEISLSAPYYTYETAAGVKARSATDSNGNVFLGGKYIELGLCKYGSFGTVNEEKQQANFHNKWFGLNAPYASGASHLGLIVDGDGWNQGADPTDGDFFVPGSPFEAWELSYEVEGEKHAEVKSYSVAGLSNGGRLRETWNQEPSTVDTSDTGAGRLSAKTTAETGEGLAVEILYEFDEESKFYNTKVNLVNNSGKELKNVKFARTFDPDQDEWFNANYTTYNKVICNADSAKDAGAKNYSMVVARGNSTLDGFFFIALDNRSVALNNAWGVLSLGSSWDDEQNRNVYYYEEVQEETVRSYATDSMLACSQEKPNGYTLEDTGIGILFNLGDMKAEGTDALRYYSSLDPNVINSFEDILKEEDIEIDPEEEELPLIEVTLGEHGYGPISFIEATEEGTFRMPALKESVYVEPGYEFIGWTLSGDETGKVYYVGEEVPVFEDTAIVAVYREITEPVSVVTEEMLADQGEGSIREVDLKDGNFSAAGLGTATSDNLAEVLGIDVGESKYNVWLKTEDAGGSAEAEAISRYLNDYCKDGDLKATFTADVFVQKDDKAPIRIRKEEATGKVYATILLTDEELIKAALKGKLGIVCMEFGKITEIEMTCISFNEDTSEFTFELLEF